GRSRHTRSYGDWSSDRVLFRSRPQSQGQAVRGASPGGDPGPGDPGVPGADEEPQRLRRAGGGRGRPGVARSSTGTGAGADSPARDRKSGGEGKGGERRVRAVNR